MSEEMRTYKLEDFSKMVEKYKEYYKNIFKLTFNWMPSGNSFYVHVEHGDEDIGYVKYYKEVFMYIFKDGIYVDHDMKCLARTMGINLKDCGDHAEIVKKDAKSDLKPIEEDPVNHPSHYMSGGIEVHDFISAWHMNFDEGNVIKYVTRAPYKRKEVEDLKKARWYLDKLIEEAEKSEQRLKERGEKNANRGN